jgi:hypothetical protein
MDYVTVERLAAQTVHDIFRDLADRRGMPKDLLRGADWQGARDAATAVIVGVICKVAEVKGEK